MPKHSDHPGPHRSAANQSGHDNGIERREWGFIVTPATANDNSVCKSSASYKYFPPDNYFINCDTFAVTATTVFGGGQVVFKGGLWVQGNGSGPHCVVFNQPVGATAPTVNPSTGDYDVCAPASPAVTPAPSGDMTVVIKSGDLTRQNADFVARTFFLPRGKCCSWGVPDLPL